MSGAEAQALQSSFTGVVRALGLLRPDTTPCGQAMSITEAHALSELHAQGPITQQQLGRALRLEKSTISRLVDQLTSAGLVERAPNPHDRRSRLVGLTATGTHRARRLEDARRDLFERLLGALTPNERRLVVDGVTRLARTAHVLE
jgi:DNA-binding MarR family transcriptional regulator